MARFPGPVTLYPARGKRIALLFIGGLFTIGGCWMILSDKPNGWFVFIFFAICTVVAAVMLLPGAVSLVLDRDGFEFTSLFRRHRSRWRDVKSFEFVSLALTRQNMVVYDDINQSGRPIAQVSTALAGRNSALPDTYGLAGDDLARLMTKWRQRALAA